MTGIDLDSMTLLIARDLYPPAEIRAESFADSPGWSMGVTDHASWTRVMICSG